MKTMWVGGIVVATIIGVAVFKIAGRSTQSVEAFSPTALPLVGSSGPGSSTGTEMAQGLIVNLSADRVSVDQNGETKEVVIDPNTVVLIGGRAAPAAELVQGQRIKVHYRVIQGQPVATSIVVDTPLMTLPPKTTPIQGNPVNES